ncbi:hypothetical protein HK097_009575, partial [Rhizophlyctis rosea]
MTEPSQNPTTEAVSAPPPEFAKPAPVDSLTYPYPMDCLRNTTIADVLKTRREKFEKGEKELIDVSEDATVEEVLNTLDKHHITTVAVYKGDETHRDHYSLVGVRELLDYGVFQHIFRGGEKSVADLLADPENEDYFELVKEKEVEAFYKHSLQTLITTTPSAQNTPSVKSSAPLLDAVKIMKDGAHYVLVRDEDGKAETVLSQGDVVGYLYDRCGDMKRVYEMGVEGVLRSTMEECLRKDPNQAGKGVEGAHLKYAIKQPSNLSALALYKTLQTHHTTSLALMDPLNHTQITGNISVSDYRSTHPANLTDLLLPATEYMAKHTTRLGTPITIPQNSTLLTAMRSMLDNDVRGIWVLSTDGNPTLIGKITYTDILKCCVPPSPTTATAEEPEATARDITTFISTMQEDVVKTVKEGEKTVMEGISKLAEGVSGMGLSATEGVMHAKDEVLKAVGGVLGAATGWMK